MNVVYRKKNFNIYQFDNEYIVHNIHKDFSEGHTHISNFKTAKFLIDLSLHLSIPHHLPNYLLESLARLSENDDYANKIRGLINMKEIKNKDKFYNSKARRSIKYSKRVS